MKISRRSFLWSSGAATLGFVGLRAFLRDAHANLRSPGFGELVDDRNGILRLPPGFSYEAFSDTGDPTDDGLRVPGGHDGMAAFRGPEGRVILVRNHELSNDVPQLGPFGDRNERLTEDLIPRLYDAGCGKMPGLGATTTVVYDVRRRKVERQFVSLAGTWRNCAGGPTPWGTWLSCEESVQRSGGMVEKDHGFVFEVPASPDMRMAEPLPLKAMGRFNHEAAAVDVRTGCVYLTEDRGGNGILQPRDRGFGLLYRFVPRRPGALAHGGRLQALKIREQPTADTTNWLARRIVPGQSFDVEWVDLRETDSPNDDLRFQGAAKGAAGFSRNEGIWAGKDVLYFCSTDGGSAGKGQVWRYRPAPDEAGPGEEKTPGRLDLFAEPNESTVLKNCDNLTISPQGDLVLCEDSPGLNCLVGVTPEGRFYPLAQSVLPNSEFAGACFNPDGTVLFVNLQRPGLTLAIFGPDSGGFRRPARV